MSTFEIAEPLRSILPSLTERFRAEGWWGDHTFTSCADSWAEIAPDAPFAADDDGACTRGQLLDRARRLATSLAKLGLERGSVIGLQLPNSVAYVTANLACEYAGLVWVNLSMGYGTREMTEILGSLRAQALVTAGTFGGHDRRGTIEVVAREVTTLRAVVVDAVDAGSPWPSVTSLCSEPADHDLIAERRLAAGEVYSIALSSGTTSARPKEALRSVDSMLSALTIMNRDFRVGADDRLLVLAPQTGGTGYSYSVAVPAFTGASATVTELGLGPELVAKIAAWCPTVLVAVPTQMSRLLDLAGGDRTMWSQLRLIINSGAPLLGEVAARAEATCGCPILSVYGATDGLVPVMSSPDDPPEIRHGSVGRVIAGHQLRIVDDAGADVATGDVGEILGFGPGMAFGYVDNPAEMARAWDTDGWWHSGDLGVLDANGRLRVVGRKKEMILRGGVNISPLEIEELLSDHPDVAEVAVVPMPHPDLLEQACAFVVPRTGTTVTLSELTTFLERKGVAKVKWPERVELRDVIPRTPAQKIDKLALKAEIAALVSGEPGGATGGARAEDGNPR